MAGREPPWRQSRKPARFCPERVTPPRPRSPRPLRQASTWVVVTTDANNNVNEVSGATSNTAISIQPVLVSSYAVSVSAGISLAPAGTDVPLQGRTFNPSNGSAVPNAAATVRILTAGTRRVIPVTSDASGNFATVFHPLPNEAGTYAVAADLPSVTVDVTQATFVLVGMMFTPATLSHQLTVGVPLTNQVTLGNLGNTPAVRPYGDCAWLGSQSVGPGSGPRSLGRLDLSSAHIRHPGKRRFRTTKFAANSRDQRRRRHRPLSLSLQVAPKSPNLVAAPTSLTATMLVGSQRTVELDVSNQGSAPSGPLICLLPSAPWLSLATSQQLVRSPLGQPMQSS